MTGTRHDPSAAFFTPDRLAYYRDLHKRYPLWCGDWPEQQRSLPDYWQWHLEPRLGREANRLTGQQFVHTPSETDSTNKLVQPRLVTTEDGELVAMGDETMFSNLPAGEVRRLDSLAKAALFSAIYATLAGPSARSHPYNIIEGWIEELTHRLGRPDIRGEIMAAAEMKPDMISGTYLLALGQLVLEAPYYEERRTKPLKTLRDAWMNLGIEVGIIPRLGGGSLVALPGEFLARFANETRCLLSEVKHYQPPPDDLPLLRQLITGRESPLKPDQRGLLEELERVRGPRAAAERERKMLIELDTKSDTQRWARRLHFPMLTEEEIDLAVSQRRPDSEAAACRLLEKRLSPDMNTLRNTLIKFRSKSR